MLLCRASGGIQEAARRCRDSTGNSTLGCRENPAQAFEGDRQVSDDRHFYVLGSNDGVIAETRLWTVSAAVTTQPSAMHRAVCVFVLPCSLCSDIVKLFVPILVFVIINLFLRVTIHAMN